MTKKSFLFRVDASTQIGTGHLMRCLALANQLKKYEAEVAFTCWNLSNDLKNLIVSKNFQFFDISTGLYTTQVDWENTLDTIKTLKSHPDWIIVDHYGLDTSWEKAVKKSTKSILAIDDLADRTHTADLLLDQTFTPQNKHRYKNLTTIETKFLLGPEFALLREEFLTSRTQLKNREGHFNKILVSFGGSDPTNETQKVVLGLKEYVQKNGLSVDVVIGSANPHWKVIENFCIENQNFRFMRQVTNMAEIMSEADLAIGAGGTSSWERCCLGLPSLVSILAKNQEETAISLHQYGVLINLGWAKDLTSQSYVEAVEQLTVSALTNMSNQGMKLVDGHGTNRVVNELLNMRVS